MTKKHKTKIWTDERVSKLIELFPYNTNKVVAKELDTTEFSVASKAGLLNLYKSKEIKIRREYRIWSKELEWKLIELYPKMKNKDIAKEMGLSINSVESKAGKLNLHKNSEHIKVKQTLWTEEDVEKLTNIYPTMKNEDIAKNLNFSQGSIKNKAHRLGLQKISSLKKEKRTPARKLTYNFLKETALKFKTKTEFLQNDKSAYNAASNTGILEEICKHMTIMSFSIPQLILRDILDSLLKSESLYDSRKIIKPYQIDVYYPEFNLAFEYQGKGWHEDNPNDSIKLNIFKERNINIIYIVENSRRYEEDIKSQLINKLAVINTICNMKITEDDIFNCVVGNIYLKLYNKEELINVAKNYTSFKEFIKSEGGVYEKLCKMKLIDEATEHMTDKRRIHKLEDVIQTIKKYVNVRNLIREDFDAYCYIRRHKLWHLISNLKGVKHRVVV